MDEFITRFSSLLWYVSYLRDEKEKLHRFLSSLPAHMKERIELVNPNTMDKVIQKPHMCYQQSNVKGEAGRNWPPKKGQKIISNFKDGRYGNYNNTTRNTANRQ